MFLAEPDQSQLDLNFRVGNIPVRVHPLFWVFTAFLGLNSTDPRAIDFRGLFIWIGCVFVSILVHELGHVLMGELFGAYGHIILYSFGGLAVGSSALSNRWKRIAVYFAGPGAGFILFGVVLLFFLIFRFRPLPSGVEKAIFNLMYINLIWGLVNLLPIWPLDGGQISRDFFDWLMPRKGILFSLGISAALAGLLAIPFLYRSLFFEGLFFGMLAFSSIQAFLYVRNNQGPGTRGPNDLGDRDRAPWQQDADYWR